MMQWDPRAPEIAARIAALSSAAEREAAVLAACVGDENLAYLVTSLLKAYVTASDELAALATMSAETIPDVNTAYPLEFHGIPDSPGSWIGPYRLVRMRGEGGMGCVWEAEQLAPIERRVALKLIKAGRDSSQILRRFNAERQALARMSHPNIAQVFDAGEANDGARPYFAMELVPGDSITRFCDEERLDTRHRLELFLDVCAAVQHAHQKGVIHRDLKPSNILVALIDAKPAVKVIDFGVAKATQGRLAVDPLTTEFGNIVGTLEYMAPEQAEPDNLDIDTRADIYSLGVVLYELLAGSPPFSRRQFGAANLTGLIRAIREVDPPKPSTRLSGSDDLPELARHRGAESRALARQVEGDLDWIVMKCLEKERSRRYETASELAADLRRFLADEPVLAGPPSAGYKLRKFLRRHRAKAIVAGVLFLVCMLGAVGTASGYIRARAENAEMRVQRDRALAAETEAEEERDVIKGVLDFVHLDLLVQRDASEFLPRYGIGNPKLTVRQALDGAAGRAARRLKEPYVLARVREAIGVAYMGLGDFKAAEGQLKPAVEAAEELLVPDHRFLLKAKSELAVVKGKRGDPRAAIALLEDVLRVRLDKLPPGHPEIVGILNQLGLVHLEAGEADAARDRFRQAEAAAPDDPENEVRVMLIRVNLAEALRARRKPREASDEFEAIMPRLEALLPKASVELAIARDNHAMTLVDLGEFQKALSIFNRNLAVFRGELSPGHFDSLRCEENIAYLHVRRGERAAAVRGYEEVAKKWDDAFGPESVPAAKARYHVGFAKLQAGDAEGALAAMREAAERADRGENVNSVDFDLRAELGKTLGALGRAKEAATELDRVVRRQAAVGAANHPKALENFRSLGIFRRMAGDLAEARRALIDGRARLPAGKPTSLHAEFAQVLSLVEFDMKNYAAAELAARDAAAAYREVPDAGRVVNALITAGASLAFRAEAEFKKDPAAARRQAEEAFELLGKNLTAVEARPRAKDAASLKSQAVLVERASRGLAAACALRGDHEGASKWKTRADGVGREFSVAPAAKPASKAPKAAKTAP